MIKFFRKIRQRLLTENPPAGRAGKFSKYLLYAMGEIVLVVIGIMIALSLNNWNERRKDIDLEQKLLKNLVENLEHNCEQLRSRIGSISYYKKHGAVIMSTIENKLSYHDSLENYFHLALLNTGNMRLSNVGYEAIKDVGLEIVRNEMLKKELMMFFEENQPEFHTELKWEDVDKTNREKFIDDHGIMSPKNGGIRYEPFDANKLFLDRYFIAIIYKTDLRRDFFSMIMKEHLNESQELLNTVKKELNE